MKPKMPHGYTIDTKDKIRPPFNVALVHSGYQRIMATDKQALKDELRQSIADFQKIIECLEYEDIIKCGNCKHFAFIPVFGGQHSKCMRLYPMLNSDRSPGTSPDADATNCPCFERRGE